MANFKLILINLIFNILTLNVVSNLAEEGCNLKFPEKGQAFRPLIFNSDETELLVENYKGYYKVANGNDAILTCKQHNIEDENINSVMVHCDNSQLFDSSNKEIEVSRIVCTMRVIELHSMTSPECNGSLAVYQFYDLNSPNKFTVAETCYDSIRNIPIYSHYFISSPPLYIESSTTTLPASYMSAYDILSTYRSDELNPKVTQILGKGHSRSNEYLRTVSLIPKDHLHSQFKDVSRRAHNLITMWENVLSGNFENLVLDIKKLRKHSRTFEVLSGVSQKPFRAMNTNGEITEIFLREKKTVKTFPVPQFYWLFIYEKEQQKAVYFIINNDTENTETEDFCPNICEEISWIQHLLQNHNYKNPELGKTICCSIENMIDEMKSIPIIQKIVENNSIILLDK